MSSKKTIVAILIGVLLSLPLSMQLAYSWTGNTNTFSPGYVEIDQINATQYYWNSVNRTDVLQYPEQTASYIIFKDGSTYYAKNGFTGQIDYSGTDASLVINNAINAVSNYTGGLIYIKAGYYYLSDTIVLKKFVGLKGEGARSTRLQLLDNVNKDVISFGQQTYGSSFIYIGHLYITGNIDNQTAGNGIRFYDDGNTAMDFLIEWVYVRDCKENGIYLSNTWGARVTNSLSEGNGEAGFKLQVSTQEYYDNLYAGQNGNQGFYVLSGRNVRMINCRAEGEGVSGFEIRQTHGGSFTNLLSIDAGTHNYYIRGVENCTFVNCIADGLNGTNWGFRIREVDSFYSKHLSFIGIQAYDHLVRGVDIYEDSEDISIIAGQIYDNLDNIAIASNTTRIIVRFNSGYITESEGSTTLINGTSSITLSHGCDYTPSAGDISIHPIEDLGSASHWYVDTITSTQFTIHVNVDPGQDVDFAWSVDRH